MEQHLFRCLRSLQADCLGKYKIGGLRRRHRSTAGGLGVQLRSARKCHRVSALLNGRRHACSQRLKPPFSGPCEVMGTQSSRRPARGVHP